MASIKKGLTARLAAGTGAVALASLIALGGALPASAAPNIDTAEPGSIVVHKHEQSATPGSLGTGSANDPVAGAPINGVEFQIREIGSFDVLDNADWLALPFDAQAVADDPEGYDLGEATTRTTATHAEFGAGVAEFSDLELGAYLVEEIVPASSVDGPNIVIPHAPFVVVVPQAVESTSDWLYEVHVYPKNATVLVEKEVEAAAHQVLGTAVTWTVTSTAPRPPVDSDGLESYAVTDVLAAELDYVEGSAAVWVGGSALVVDEDFSVDAAGGTLTVTITDLAELTPGAEVVVTFDTAVTAIGDGSIDNTASVVINDRSVPSTTDTDYWGSVELFKHDGEAEGEAPGRGLAGAVFELRDGNGVALRDAAGQPIRYTSEPDGNVRIAGLRTGETPLTYQLVEVQAPSGYVLPANEADRVHAFTVDHTLVRALDVENEQVPAYALPITGGSGQAAFMIGGAGLILGALGFALLRRRKAQAGA